MRRSREMTLSFPPFTKAVTWLLAINTGIFLLLELFAYTLPDIVRFVFVNFGLEPKLVLHGWIWQIVTYSFIHVGFMHWFGNMIGIWMFGAAFEGSCGTRRFLELYGVGIIGAALTTIVLSYGHAIGSPEQLTVGASGGVFAILIAFGMVFGENEIMLIPFPFTIKAKYFVAILIVVTLALAIGGGGSVAYVAHLGGLFFGYLMHLSRYALLGMRVEYRLEWPLVAGAVVVAMVVVVVAALIPSRRAGRIPIIEALRYE